MKKLVLTLSLLLGFAAHAEDNNAAKQPDQNQPAASAPSTAAKPAAEEAIPCPLPGEPASNCPAPNRSAEDTEGGVPYVASAGIRPEINLKIILSTPGQNARSDAQPYPLLNAPKKSGTSK